MFIEIPASKNSIANRKLIHGKGINDASYAAQPKINGKRLMCPYYQKWHSMIKRCYSEVIHKKRPTYIGCTVCDEWLTFSGFKEWMIKQNWQGMHLDKDIIKPGNKVYSPDNCSFVTQELNSLLNDHGRARGFYPQGVHFYNPTGKYKAQINANGTKIAIGYYSTIEAARKAYKKVKTALIFKTADEQTDPRIANGLRLHAEILNKH